MGKEIKDKPDFAIFWDKDIYLAERLEAQGIKLFNSSSAINLCDNKILMYQELIKKNVRIPHTFIAPKTFEGLGYKNREFLDSVITSEFSLLDYAQDLKRIRDREIRDKRWGNKK